MPVCFTDNMVLQRGAPVAVWGEAEPGSKLTVEFSGQAKSGVASEHGKWRVMLDPMPASSVGRNLVVFSPSTNNCQPLTFHNVVVGEVWLAGGQSNMGFALRSHTDWKQHLPAEPNPSIRILHIPVTEFGEINRTHLKWRICDRTTVPNFSAVAFFFATELQQRLQVPVGIIGSYRGGTWNENWMTPASIQGEPDLKYLFDQYDAEYGKFANEAEYEVAYQKFLVAVKTWEAAGGWSSGPRPMAPTGPKAYQRPSGLYECMIKPLQPYTIKGVIWYQGEGNSDRYKEFRTLFPAFIEGWRKTWENPELPFYFVQLPPFKDVSWPPFRQVQLRFRHAGGGLELRPGASDAFEIAGADKEYFKAEVHLKGDALSLWNEAVKQPAYVRYAFSPYPDMVLFNKEGLPASPFTTEVSE